MDALGLNILDASNKPINRIFLSTCTVQHTDWRLNNKHILAKVENWVRSEILVEDAKLVLCSSTKRSKENTRHSYSTLYLNLNLSCNNVSRFFCIGQQDIVSMLCSSPALCVCVVKRESVTGVSVTNRSSVFPRTTLTSTWWWNMYQVERCSPIYGELADLG